MSYLKNHQIEILERGYGDSDKLICSDHIKDTYIFNMILNMNLQQNIPISVTLLTLSRCRRLLDDLSLSPTMRGLFRNSPHMNQLFFYKPLTVPASIIYNRIVRYI